MNIEFRQGSESHSSTWAKFFVKGLEDWAVKEETLSDNHSSYQEYVCLDVPEGTIFTAFEQDGTKRGTDTFRFSICTADNEASELKASYTSSGWTIGNFKVLVKAEGKVKAPRLMDWWLDNGQPRNPTLEYALHCAAHIDKRGLKNLPPFTPITEPNANPHAAADNGTTPTIKTGTVKHLQSRAAETLETPEKPDSQKQWLNPGLIQLDAGTQSRKQQSQQTIDDYAEQMLDSRWNWEQEPLPIIFSDGENFWPADGHHRIMAALSAQADQILTEVRSGTLRDAIFFSTSANKYHGLPRTNADKRNQVELLLTDPEWQQMSDRAIAEHCGVSAPLVGKVRAELAESGTVNISTERVDRKGRKLDTSNIGTKPKAERPKAAEPEHPTRAALIEEVTPFDPELLKHSPPEAQRAITNGQVSLEQTQPQTAAHSAEPNLKVFAETQTNTLSQKVGAKTIAEIALNLCTPEEIREIHANLSLHLEAVNELLISCRVNCPQ